MHVGFQAKDALGQTPVHVAASRDSADMMLLLLNYSPDLNAQDANLRTPVMLAASGHTEVLGITWHPEYPLESSRTCVNLHKNLFKYLKISKNPGRIISNFESSFKI